MSVNVTIQYSTRNPPSCHLFLYVSVGVGTCIYLSTAVVFKLLSDEGVKSIPVRTGQVAAYCPQVAKYEGLTQHIVEMLGILTPTHKHKQVKK